MRGTPEHPLRCRLLQRLSVYPWYPDADGIHYPSRHADERPLNSCLARDRCGGAQDLRLQPLGTLAHLRPTVLVAAERYRLRVDRIWHA